MPEMDYEQFLVRRPAGRSPVMALLSGKQVPGSAYDIDARWISGIPGDDTASANFSDRDQVLIFLGGDYRKPQVLGAGIEFSVGGQPIAFNTSTSFFIPAGTPHGPLVWNEFRKDHLLITLKCGLPASLASAPVKPVKDEEFDYEQYAVRSPMREAGAEFSAGRTAPTMTMMSGVQVPGVKYYIEVGWTFGMPVSKIAGSGMPEMVHRRFDEIVLHIGGDPRTPEDLGGEVEFFVGGQPLLFNTTSALFIPAGTRHGPLALKKYAKPHLVMAIMCGAGTIQEGWGDSFKTA